MARSRWLVVVLAVLCLSLAGSVATYAAFTAQTSNSANTFTAGSWVTYGGTGPEAARTSSGPVTVSYPTATGTGDGLLLVEVNAANQAITTPSGWGLLADQATNSPSQMRSRSGGSSPEARPRSTWT